MRLVIGWDAEHGALGLLADDVTRLRPDGRSRTRTRRDFRAGTLTVDGLTSSMPARFVPIEEVSAAQY